MTMPAFPLPAKVAARLASPARSTPKRPEAQPAFEIVSIAEWPAYRAAHPELEFTGNFDFTGRPIFSPPAAK